MPASKIFPIEYLYLLLIQFVILFIMFFVLRIIVKFKRLTAICLSFVTTAFLSLLFLCFDIRSLIPIMKVDLYEYLTGTYIVVIPFGLILIGKPAFILLKKNYSFLREWIRLDQRQSSPEKDRILKMVEDNKITTAEASELLEAMGKSSALRGEEKFSRIDFVVLAGVAFVVLGFFLPWVYFNFPVRTLVGQLAGYQMGYHSITGWAVFVMAVLSAVPIFVTPKNFLYKISMFQIFLTVIGAIIVISVLIRAGSHLHVGLIFCLIGFIVSCFASVAKFRKLAA